jgi:hypothetical protein
MPSDGAFQLESKGTPFAAITDGLSNTFLVGEKHVPLKGFGVGYLDGSQYNGDYPSCSTRGAGPGMELATDLNDPGWKFGSYHPQVCQFVMADGSVRVLLNTTRITTLALLACRNDGQPIPDE